MKIIGTFFNIEYECEEVVYLLAPTIEAAKIFMDRELPNFAKEYEDIPYDEWKKNHPDSTPVDFYYSNAYYDYLTDCKYNVTVIFDEDAFDFNQAFEININGGRV